MADFLTGNIAILFIPPTVGIMASVEEIKQIIIPLLVICISTTLLIMGVTGWVAQAIIRMGKSSES